MTLDNGFTLVLLSKMRSLSISLCAVAIVFPAILVICLANTEIYCN
jgi:hypothetical protein